MYCIATTTVQYSKYSLFVTVSRRGRAMLQCYDNVTNWVSQSYNVGGQENAEARNCSILSS